MRRWARIAFVVVLSLATATGVASATDVGVSATVAGPPPVEISQLACVPTPYDPTTGPASISFALSTGATASAVVTGLDASIVAIIGPTTCVAGPNSLVWDGHNLVGDLVAPSWYVCAVSATNGATQDAETCSIAVSYGAPVALKNAKAKPKKVKPTDSVVELSVSLSRAAQLSVTIINSGGTVIRALPSAPRDAGPVALTWDVRNSAGVRPPAGDYTVIFRATDTGGNVAADTTSVQLSR